MLQKAIFFTSFFWQLTNGSFVKRLILHFFKRIARAIQSITRSELNGEHFAVLQRSLLSEISSRKQIGKTRPYSVAVQGLHDPLYYSLFAAIMTDLGKQLPVSGYLLLVHSISCAVGTGWRQSIMRSLPISWLMSSRWVKANRELVGPVGYRSHSLRHPIGDILDWFMADRHWKLSQLSSDISELTIDGVLIGDLVIDSYLRFKPSPEFKVVDPFVKHIIWQALRDLRRARRFFGKIKPKLYLSSYSTYVEHGVAVRVALSRGVSVRVYGNLAAFGKDLSLDDFYHTPETSHYRKTFTDLPDQTTRLTDAEQALNFRLTGGVDVVTSYMKTSAYKLSNEIVPNVLGEVVVFLHDFYDSPHIYADLVFPDFWAWITFTIETLNKAKIKFWIKPHPNQINLSDLAFDQLLRIYPDLRIISPRITNFQLVSAGMCCGVTVYGTVAHELAYMGIPSIGCARHPHQAFNFCRTATSREEYAEFLKTPSIYPLTVQEMRNQALQFFYMHNLYGDDEDLALRAQFAKFVNVAGNVTTDFQPLLDELAALRKLPAWECHVSRLVKEIVKY